MTESSTPINSSATWGEEAEQNLSTFVHWSINDICFFLALTTSWNTNSTTAPATSARKMISTMMKNWGGERRWGPMLNQAWRSQAFQNGIQTTGRLYFIASLAANTANTNWLSVFWWRLPPAPLTPPLTVSSMQRFSMTAPQQPRKPMITRTAPRAMSR